MTPFSAGDIAAWVDEQFDAFCADKRQDYELQPGEFTAAMYAEATDLKQSTAHARLLKLRKANRIPARQELIGSKWTWVYTMPKETE